MHYHACLLLLYQHKNQASPTRTTQNSNTDSLIGASDLVDFLPFYGEEFTPEPLTIEGMSVEEWMEQQSSSSGGWCDYSYPEGIHGEPVYNIDLISNNYNVPDGKNLYITQCYTFDGTLTLLINAIPTPIEVINGWYRFGENPIVAKSGDIISVSNVVANAFGISAILIDQNIDVEHISLDLQTENYLVPNGKKLYLMRAKVFMAIQPFLKLTDTNLDS